MTKTPPTAKPAKPVTEESSVTKPTAAQAAQRLAAACGRGVVPIAERIAADEIDPATVLAMLDAGDIDSATALVFGTAKAT